MRIKQLNIVRFGKLCDREIVFDGGFNAVKGDNESGKSTLQAFIKFMLYGLPRRSAGALIGERERALSWLGGVAAGSMTVEHGGRTLRIERNGKTGARGAYTEKHKTVDLATGEEVLVGEIPGEALLGIDASAYDSMCNVRQLECTSVDGGAVKNAIENLLSGGDEGTSIASASKLLEKERIRLLHKNSKGGAVYEAERECDRLESEYEQALSLESEMIKMSEELTRAERQLEAAKEKYRIEQSICDLFEDAKRLEKFDQLEARLREGKEISSRISTLDRENGAEKRIPSYEETAGMKHTAEALRASRERRDRARGEMEAAERRLGGARLEKNEHLEELLSEYGSARSVASNLNAKNKKRLAQTWGGIAFAALSLAFAVGAVALMIGVSAAGAVTAAFLAVSSASASYVLLSRAKRAEKEAAALALRVGNDVSFKDAETVFERLDEFSSNVESRREAEAAYNEASARLAVAEEDLASVSAAAEDTLAFWGAVDGGDRASALEALSARLSAYLDERAALTSSRRENEGLVRSLGDELEGYDRAAIEKRLTPEVKEKIAKYPFERLKSERDSWLDKTNQLSGYKARLEREIGVMQTGKRKPSVIFPELEQSQRRLSELRIRHEAIVLAAEKLEEASKGLKRDITPRIKGRAERNMSVMTGGKYSELFLDDDMNLTVFAEGETRPIDLLSKGSCDAAYFSVRLALLDVMCGESRPPVFLDESLSQLDDTRASRAIEVLDEYCRGGGQCVLFTCQERDVKLAEKMIGANFIEL